MQKQSNLMRILEVRLYLTSGLLLSSILFSSLLYSQLPIKEYPAQRASYNGHQSGKFTAKVTKGRRGEGSVGGTFNYSYQFEIPTLQPLTQAQCNPHSPVSSIKECKRSCAKMDSYKRYLSGILKGVPAISGRFDCHSSISGTLPKMTVTEAYDVCKNNNAWGSTTTSNIRAIVGPLYHFNNPRTSRSNKVWRYENTTELMLPYVSLNPQVVITCINRKSFKPKDVLKLTPKKSKITNQ